MKKTFITILATAALGVSASQASLIMYEDFNYTLSSTNPDPDGGVNGGNGLPYTNVGGSPSGTSTGLRNTWGANTQVVSGLSYSGLVTSNNALIQTNAGWQDGPFAYRFMTTDPFLSLRVGGVNNGNFGADGTTLYFSYLFKVDDVSAINRFVWACGTNIYLGLNTASSGNFTVAGATSTSGSVALTNGVTNLVVGRVQFTSGTDTMDLWINPTVSGFDGSAPVNVTATYSSLPLASLKFNGNTANNFTLDEFRLGESFSDVLPVPEPTTWALFAGSLTTLMVFRRRRQS